MKKYRKKISVKKEDSSWWTSSLKIRNLIVSRKLALNLINYWTPPVRRECNNCKIQWN